MTIRTQLGLAAITIALAVIGACGPPADHTATLTRLRDAIGAPIASPTQLEDHNQLVENVVQSGALEGLRQFEVQERLGRGTECGARPICHERGFRPTDWIYDVGRDPNDPQLAAGPTLIVGFDSTGIVDNTYFVTRR
ncbi:MAG: hypothetical protein M3Y87_16135 [Myxococcota bacterium]|nr:hypothetical protein [Myxococcota bacterium]